MVHHSGEAHSLECSSTPCELLSIGFIKLFIPILRLSIMPAVTARPSHHAEEDWYRYRHWGSLRHKQEAT